MPGQEQEPVSPSGALRLSPIFFLSYAHPGDPTRRSAPAARDVHQFAARFFDDVSEHVNELLGLSAGETPGFMDRVLGGGEPWNEELRQAVGNCQVFVALLSRRYCTSQWCLREWQVFAERATSLRRTGFPTGKKAIIPVIWSPGYSDEPPSMISDVQRFVPYKAQNQTVIDLYLDRGVYGLMASELPDLRNAYQEVVWFLACRIQEVLGEYHTVPGVSPERWERLRVQEGEAR